MGQQYRRRVSLVAAEPANERLDEDPSCESRHVVVWDCAEIADMHREPTLACAVRSSSVTR